MVKEHNWVHDTQASVEMQFKIEGVVLIDRCARCGCIKITNLGDMECPVRYKPEGWTFNPFKTLKDEPPCPAKW